MIHPGDEVILFGPSYDCYEPAVKLNGGKTIEIELLAPDYKVDWVKVKETVSKRTRMIIINTPHNPTGTLMLQKDMETLSELVKDTDILILSDEVYEHIIFDGVEHQSAARYPVLAERSFIIASFGKTFHNTGWKMGYCLAPSHLMDEFKKVHQFNVFSVNHPIQKALAVYMKTSKNYLILADFYQKKRDFFLERIKDSRFTFKASRGTYFQLLDYRNISDEKDTDLAIRLTKEFKVASIPVSVFYQNKKDDKVLRFCFAKSEETLEKGAEILNRI
jgi:methionine aminotransferase